MATRTGTVGAMRRRSSIDENHRKIARASLFMKSLPDRHVERFLERGAFRTCARGETLFAQGDSAQGVHVVLSGWVKLFRITQAGAEAVVSVFKRGESFGEAASLQGREYPVSAEAVTSAELLLVPAHEIVSAVRDDPEMALSILASTYAHLHSLVRELEQLKVQTGRQRFASFLLGLCETGGEAASIALPYEKSLIASRLGMKPESLSRILARLRADGISVNGNLVEIGSVARLREIAGLEAVD